MQEIFGPDEILAQSFVLVANQPGQSLPASIGAVLAGQAPQRAGPPLTGDRTRDEVGVSQEP